MCDVCDEYLVATNYVPYLRAVDRLIGHGARVDLQNYYSFLAAFRGDLSPSEAARAAIRSMEALRYG